MRFGSAKIPVSRIAIPALILLWFHTFLACAFCSDEYCVDDQRTLLYKIINWWYDCLPDECDSYCGSVVACAHDGEAEVEYGEAGKVLVFRIDGGFAHLLTVFGKCGDCPGPSRFKCTWSNPAYFGNAEASPVFALGRFVFKGVGKKEAQTVKERAKDIRFAVSGNMLGLSNDGTVALYETGSFLRNCPGEGNGKNGRSPITVKITNAKTDELLAVYTADWNDRKTGEEHSVEGRE